MNRLHVSLQESYRSYKKGIIAGLWRGAIEVHWCKSDGRRLVDLDLG